MALALPLRDRFTTSSSTSNVCELRRVEASSDRSSRRDLSMLSTPTPAFQSPALALEILVRMFMACSLASALPHWSNAITGFINDG